MQANPLNHKQPDIHMLSGSRGMLAAKQPLVVPMLLRLSHFKLDSYVVLVVSRQKGITLVFKTDPLQNVDINSTFDSIAVIQKFIQREIEGQLRQMFREDLPGIIHRLSQQWVKAKVEAPYLNKRPPPPARTRTSAASDTGIPPYGLPPRMPAVGARPMIARAASLANAPTHRRSGSLLSASSQGRRPASAMASPESPHPSPTTHEGHNDGEHFDPTYGLRPEGIPQKSVFSTFRNLFSPDRGLAELAEEPSDVDEAEESFDSGNWEDLAPDSSYSVASRSDAGDIEEYESVPAVGGGTITRPRVIHSHSQVLGTSGESVAGRSQASSRPPRLSSLLSHRDSGTAGPSRLTRGLSSASVMERAHSWAGHYNPYFAGTTPLYATPGPLHEGDERYPFERPHSGSEYPISSSPPRSSMTSLDQSSASRLGSPSSTRTRDSLSSDVTHSIATPPNAPSDAAEGVQISRPRRPSFSSNLDRFGSPPDHLTLSEHDPKIVLKPGLSSVSRLSMLSNSNHTLSPYTRTLEHFTVRSVPPRETTSSGSGSAAEHKPVKARRKRTFFLGKKRNPQATTPIMDSRPISPAPPLSDFDASDMDRYFRSRDEFVPPYPDIRPTHVRQRSWYTNDNST